MTCVPLPAARARRAAASTEVIIIVVLVTLGCLIMLTAFGRQMALLWRADTRTLATGEKQKPPTADITDLTRELSPTFSEIAGGHTGAAPRTGPMGIELGTQADLYRNPARDPRSNASVTDLLGGAQRTTDRALADFPGTLTVGGGLDGITRDLNDRTIAGYPDMREHGGILVRRADGTVTAIPDPAEGNAGSWPPNYGAAQPGDTTIGLIHTHPPAGSPGFSPGGFSAADLGFLAAGSAPGGTNHDIMIMQLGDEQYVAMRTKDSKNVPLADLQATRDRAYQDALDNGASDNEARFAANLAMARQAGLAYYRGRPGTPLRRVN